MVDRIYWGDPARANQAAPLHQLLRFAAVHDLRITSGEYLDLQGVAHHPEGGHNIHSLHYLGRALDVSTHGMSDAAVLSLAEAATREGINVYDEREPPPCGAWTGPHLHLSISPLGTRAL